MNCSQCNSPNCPVFQKLDKLNATLLGAIFLLGGKIEVPNITSEDEYQCNYIRIFKK
jgi:hypothetical protein